MLGNLVLFHNQSQSPMSRFVTITDVEGQIGILGELFFYQKKIHLEFRGVNDERWV